MKKKVYDRTLGIKSVSRKVARLLKPVNVNVDYVAFNTYAFYNGRENSIGISIENYLLKKQLNIVFGENRNSDNIFIDRWISDLTFNPPTVQDLTDEAYGNRKFFNYNQEKETALFIDDLISSFVLVKSTMSMKKFINNLYNI
jgi:hypothetical protein